MFKFAIVFLGVLFFQPQESKAAEKLTIAALINFEPYSFYDGDKVRGIDVDIIREASKRVGVEVEFKMAPWKRVLSLVRLGKVDGGTPALRRPEREEYAYYTNVPLRVSQHTAFTAKKNPFVYNNLDSISGLKVVILRGYAIDKKFDDASKNDKFKLLETNSIDRALQQLTHGVADVFVNNDLPTLYVAKQMGYSNLISMQATPISAGEGTFLIFSKAKMGARGKDLVRQFDDALKSMADDGTSQKIISSYVR